MFYPKAGAGDDDKASLRKAVKSISKYPYTVASRLQVRKQHITKGNTSSNENTITTTILTQ